MSGYGNDRECMCKSVCVWGVEEMGGGGQHSLKEDKIF